MPPHEGLREKVRALCFKREGPRRKLRALSVCIQRKEPGLHAHRSEALAQARDALGRVRDALCVCLHQGPLQRHQRHRKKEHKSSAITCSFAEETDTERCGLHQPSGPSAKAPEAQEEEH